MRLPQHDEYGVIPHNHEEIADESQLIRYVPAVHVKYEGGLPTLSSAAFSPSTPPDDPRSSVSVDSKPLLESEFVNPPHRAKANEGFAELNVGKVRGISLEVGWDPLPLNSAHCGIWGVGKSKPMRRRLRDLAELKAMPEQ
jgi:hypothetical protein